MKFLWSQQKGTDSDLLRVLMLPEDSRYVQILMLRIKEVLRLKKLSIEILVVLNSF